MRAYHVPNLDGLLEAMVAAPSLAEAASALGVTVRSMRELGWQTGKGSAASRAKKEPGRPLYRNVVGAPGRWEEDRAVTIVVAARAARRAVR